MSEPTERLRKLLEEREVPWAPWDDTTTAWGPRDDPHMAIEDIVGTLQVTGLTPEMAVDATIPKRTGNLTCRKDVFEGGWWCKYSCCGYEYLSPFESDGIAENYCPNCGAKVVDE